MNNLLSTLHRLAERQDENFVTEVFAHFLRALIESNRPEALQLLSLLSSGRISPTPESLGAITVRTQVSTDQGRPDIAIRSPEQLVLIEVKVDSPIGPDQVRRYRDFLDRSGVRETTLTLLTRDPVRADVARIADCAVRWYEVSERLEALHFGDPVLRFVTEQFLGFLGGRGLAMEHVGWELAAGIRSLRSLVQMIDKALATHKIKVRAPCNASECTGRYLRDGNESGNEFVGIYYDQPAVLVFEAYDISAHVEALRECGKGQVQADRWVLELDLSSEEVHFFARPKDSQFRCVEDFIGKCKEVVNEIRPYS